MKSFHQAVNRNPLSANTKTAAHPGVTCRRQDISYSPHHALMPVPQQNQNAERNKESCRFSISGGTQGQVEWDFTFFGPKEVVCTLICFFSVKFLFMFKI